jgi:hypothetical protein
MLPKVFASRGTFRCMSHFVVAIRDFLIEPWAYGYAIDLFILFKFLSRSRKGCMCSYWFAGQVRAQSPIWWLMIFSEEIIFRNKIQM